MRWTPILLIIVAFAGCLADDPPTAASPSLGEPGVVRFIAIGDVGTGDENQYRVAAAIEEVCAQRGCDFAIGLGDNIYEEGVADEYDPQFEEKFERPYANLSFPWYMVLGNHDNGGGYGYDSTVGDHEVAYHYRTDRTSDKWQMPARFYTFTAGNGTVQFFALDSGPMSINLMPIHVPTLSGKDQSGWLKSQVAASEATWRFTMSHHPYISNGQHGDAGRYEGVPGAGLAWKELLDDGMCGAADIHFAGHDHDLQWLEPADGCEGTQHIVSGAGGKQRSPGNPTRNEALFQQYETYGFLWVQIEGDTLSGVFYDDNADVLFEHTFTK